MRRIAFLVVLILLSAIGAAAQTPNTINTVVGGGSQPAAAASAYLPGAWGVVWDPITGNTYVSVAGLSIVYKISSSGTITPYAGTFVAGFAGDGGAATSAELNFPTGLALDSSGNLYIADSQNNRIRKVSTGGTITTYAGSGNQYDGIGFFGGYSGDGFAATAAMMNSPMAAAFDQSGNLYIADTNNNVIRKVDNSPQHIITTYAGNGGSGTVGAGNGDGGPATSAELNSPDGVTVDQLGNIYIADTYDYVVRIVNTANPPVINTYAGTGANACTVLGDGGAATSAGLCLPYGVFATPSGILYIADSLDNRIRVVNTANPPVISTFTGSGTVFVNSACLTPTGCGDGGAATSATLNTPTSIAINGTGDVLIGDNGTNRYRVVCKATGTCVQSGGVAGDIYNFAGGGTGGDGSAATSAVISQPYQVTVDNSANLYVADLDAGRVREVNGVSQDITDFAGNGAVGIPGLADGDGGAATSANLSGNVLQLWLDKPTGDLYIADDYYRLVRKVSGGNITAVAGQNGVKCNGGGCGDGGQATSATLATATGVAVDSNGNVYIADYKLDRIRIVCVVASCPAPNIATPVVGDIYNFAGSGTVGYSGDNGPAVSATLNQPFGLAFDSNGNLYIADANNNVIRMVTPAGIISTVAFNGLPSFGGMGGPALSASMQFPQQVALDNLGNLFVGGGLDNVVVRIDAVSGTVVTVAGDVHNLDGGFNGDGGASTSALISNFALSIFTNTGSGVHTLYIADAGNNRVRSVTLAPVAAISNLIPASFGPVLAGGVSAAGIVTITNNGLDDLLVSAVQITGAQNADFQISSDSCFNSLTNTPIPVAPGGVCLLEVFLNPPAAAATGGVAATLTFDTNDPSNLVFNSALAGTVVGPPGVQLTVTAPATGSGTISATPPGVVSGNLTPISCPGTCVTDYSAGEQVTLFATPGIGFTLTGWTLSGGASGTCPVALTCTVTMNSTGTVAATFASATITVSGLGNGSGTITDNFSVISCSYNGSTTSGTCSAQASSYPAGTESIILTAATSGTIANSTFAGWLGLCSGGLASVATGPCTFNLESAGIPGINGAEISAVFSGPAQAFTAGQVFVGTVDGMIFVYNSNGKLSQVLNSATLGGIIGGMDFDSSGNLYAANFGSGNAVEHFTGGVATPTQFAPGSYNSGPLGLVIDPFGNIFVGDSSGQDTLLEFLNGNPETSNTFYPAHESGGVGYLEVLDDEARVLYTTGPNSDEITGTVKNYDVVNDHQNPDFATDLPGGPAFALRELSDKSILVANSTSIAHLDPNGNLLGTPAPYQPGGPGGLFYALNLDPSGTSFWTADALSGKVYQVQLSSGTILNTIATPLGFASTKDLATIYGLAVVGQPASGGASLGVSMSAPASVAAQADYNYSISITNGGPLAAQNVTLSDPFIAQMVINSATPSQGSCTTGVTVTCSIGTIAANAAPVTVTINVASQVSQTVVNTVTVNATTPDPIPANETFTTSTTAGAAAGAPTILLTAPADVALGTPLTYTIQVTNPAAAAIANVVVTDTLPGGLSATSLSSACTGTTSISCTIASIAAGATATLNITVVPTATGVLDNTATITGGASSGPIATDVITPTGTEALAIEVDSSNGADYVTSSGGTCGAASVCESFFPSGTMVTVTANGPGFLGWTVNGAQVAACPAASINCTVTMSSQQTVTAVYSSIAVASSQLGTGVVGIPYGADLSNGIVGGAPPYTITLTGTALPAGLTFTAPVISGTPTKAGTTNGIVVKITDSLGNKGSTTVSLQIINPPATQNALANGNYGILLHMVNDSTGSMTGLVGSLHFNGEGEVDSGTLDLIGNGAGQVPQTVSVTGTYTIGPDNRGLIILVSGGAPFATIAMSVGDVYQGVAHTAHIIKFDDNTGTGLRGAGTAKLQDPTAFNEASFAGNYIFGGTGQSSTLTRLIEEGLFTVTSTGTFGSGSDDSNINGTLSSGDFTGTYSDSVSGQPIGPTNGRTNWTFTDGTTAVSYIIDANNVVYVAQTAGAAGAPPKRLAAGTAERQLNTAPFDATFLSGPDVSSRQGPSGAAGNANSVAFLGLATFTPAAGTVSVTYDSNNAGTLSVQSTANGTYTVAASGRSVLCFPNCVSPTNTLIVYLSRQDRGYQMQANAGVTNPEFGELDLQTGGPFGNSLFATNYFFGDREPASPNRGADTEGVTSVTNNILTATFDQSHADGRLDYDVQGFFGVSVAPNGRFLFTNNSPGLLIAGNEVGLVVTPTHTIFTDLDSTNNHPSLHDGLAFTMPAGVPVGTPNPFPSFGTVQVGSNSSSATPFVLTNNSDGLLSLTSITNPADFSALSGTCVSASTVVVLPHSSCSATLNFKPTVTGLLNENITFNTDGGSLLVAVSGTGSAGAPATVTVSIGANNTSGGTIVDNQSPHIIDCTTNGEGLQAGTCSGSYGVGLVVTFTETPNAGAAFSSWDGPCNPPTGGSTTTCSITVTNPIGVTTAFFKNGPGGPFTLTVALPTSTAASTGSGSITSGVTGGNISCNFAGAAAPTGTCSNPSEPDGQIVQLTATPNTLTSTFGGWAGTCPFEVVGPPDSCYVTMSQAVTVTPVFTIVPVTVKVALTGNGSLVDMVNAGKISCTELNGAASGTCTTTYNAGTSVTLTEAPGTGYTFSSFTGCSSTSATTCTLSLSASVTTVNVTATFTINTYVLNVSTEGGNGTGTVTSSPNNLGGTINCGPNNQPPSGCGLGELFGATVVLTETPTPPTTGTTNTFTGWSASGVPGFILPAACTTGAPAMCTFSMPVVPVGATFTVTATFTEQFELMVAENGTGTGKVTSQTGLAPAINCVSGSTAGCSAFYSAGQAVILTAAATGAGSTFTGWSGAACSGVTAPTCSLTMTQPLDVTATFTISATPDFTLSAAPPSQTVTVGNSTTYTVNASALNGFTGNVGLTVGGLPAGATGTFNPTPIAPGTPSTLTVATASTTPAGTSTLTITGTSGALMHTTTVQLIVTPPAAPTLQSITVTPNPAVVPLTVDEEPGTLQFTATGNYSDGSHQNLTNTATWTQTNLPFSSLSATGLVTAQFPGGPVTITATQGNISGSALLAVGSVVVANPALNDDKQRFDGGTQPLEVTLTNTSTTQTVTFTAGGISANNENFAVSDNCTTLAPGQVCTALVTITTTALCDNEVGTVTIATNDPNGPVQFTVSGYGADNGLVVADLSNTNLITNGSFETPVIPPGTFSNFGSGSDGITGWTVVGAAGGVSIVSGTFSQDGITFPAEDGVQWVDLTGDGTNAVEGVEQTVATTAGTNYVLTFWVGNANGGIFGPTSTVNVKLGGINGTLLGTATNSMSVPGLQVWQQFTMTFTASGTSTTIDFLNGSAATNNNTGLDNVVLYAVGGTAAQGPNQILTPQILAQRIVGPGVLISNVKYTGAPLAAGTFTGGANILGLSSGVVLSTGSVRNVVGPNCIAGTDGGISGINDQPGDPDLTALLGPGGVTNDAAILEFDFVPTSSSISFQYVFASDEYALFVGQFNDVFGFFVNGANIALIPGTTEPVTISNVNGGNPFVSPPIPPSNPQFFVNNDVEFPSGTPPFDTEMNGMTVVLTAQGQVNPGVTNHIKLAIADATDFEVDSNVFIASGSLTSSAISFNPPGLAFGNEFVGEKSASLPVTISNTGSTPVTISTITASAPFGQTNTCTAPLAPSGQTGSTCTVTVTVTPAAAGNISGTLIVQDNSPSTGSQQTISLSANGVVDTTTHFSVTAPSSATSAVPFNFTVTALDASGNTVPTYAGTVQFTSSDDSAQLPPPTKLTNGVGTFSATLFTTGTQTITATDTVTASITGTSGPIKVISLQSIAVTPANPTIQVGAQQQFTATGTFSDGSQQNLTNSVTWSASTISPEGTVVASIVSTPGVAGSGLATALAAGTATITATATNSEISGSTTLTASVAPFTLTVIPPPGVSPSTGPTVPPGGVLTFGITLTSQPGFSGLVTLSCTTDTPSITCQPAPSQINLVGATQVAIVLNTFCTADTLPLPQTPGGPGGGVGILLAALLMAGTAYSYRKRQRVALTFAVLMLIALGTAACSGGPAQSPTGAATPAGPHFVILKASTTVNGKVVSAATGEIPFVVQ
ncbi:MAG TPA: choice-of-anchor L domain-containing protein [Candidatus Sulfotelmatobacter sp.]|nr:choice-of-anchor L domain-containing protein [Candidatus Sulfotelmatobacter sp.]